MSETGAKRGSWKRHRLAQLWEGGAALHNAQHETYPKAGGRPNMSSRAPGVGVSSGVGSRDSLCRTSLDGGVPDFRSSGSSPEDGRSRLGVQRCRFVNLAWMNVDMRGPQPIDLDLEHRPPRQDPRQNNGSHSECEIRVDERLGRPRTYPPGITWPTQLFCPVLAPPLDSSSNRSAYHCSTARLLVGGLGLHGISGTSALDSLPPSSVFETAALAVCGSLGCTVSVWALGTLTDTLSFSRRAAEGSGAG